MADTHAPASGDGRHDRGPHRGMPRWVKVSLLVGAALVALLVIGKLTGVGGDHGPGRHGGGHPAGHNS